RYLHGRLRSGLRLRGDPVARGGSAALDYHAIHARGIRSPENRPEVVRILDAIEHDDQWRARCAAEDLVDVVLGAQLDLGDDALVDAALSTATRFAIEHVGGHARDAHTALGRQREQLLQPIVGTVTDAKRFHASRAQGLEDWVDPINDHAGLPGFPTSARTD